MGNSGAYHQRVGGGMFKLNAMGSLPRGIFSIHGVCADKDFDAGGLGASGPQLKTNGLDESSECCG